MGDEVRPDPRLLAYLKRNFQVAEDHEDAEEVIVMGGDGRMLRAVHQFGKGGRRLFGLNYGHVGFLMNEPRIEVVKQLYREEVEVVKVKLLQAKLYDADGRPVRTAYAFNDFYFERASSPTARIKITIDGRSYLDPLSTDGAIVCTPAGSTAYNASAGGPIVPIDSRCIVVTGICPAIFHHWRSALLSEKTKVSLRAVDIENRPVRFLADGRVIDHVLEAIVECADKAEAHLVFARSQDFRRKVSDLQFSASMDPASRRRSLG